MVADSQVFQDNRYIYYSDVIMDTMESQITSLTIVYSTVYSGADERRHQSSASLAFVGGIHRWLLNSPHKGPVTLKLFPFDDVIMPSSINRRAWFMGMNVENGWWKWNDIDWLPVANFEWKFPLKWHQFISNFDFPDALTIALLLLYMYNSIYADSSLY